MFGFKAYGMISISPRTAYLPESLHAFISWSLIVVTVAFRGEYWKICPQNQDKASVFLHSWQWTSGLFYCCVHPEVGLQKKHSRHCQSLWWCFLSKQFLYNDHAYSKPFQVLQQTLFDIFNEVVLLHVTDVREILLVVLIELFWRRLLSVWLHRKLTEWLSHV